MGRFIGWFRHPDLRSYLGLADRASRYLYLAPHYYPASNTVPRLDFGRRLAQGHSGRDCKHIHS